MNQNTEDFVEYSKHTYDTLTKYARDEFEARQSHIHSLLKTLITTSILFASAWIILVSSSKGIDLSEDIVWCCIAHIVVVALSVITNFLLVLSHHFSLTGFRRYEHEWNEIYSHILVRRGSGGKMPTHSPQALIEEFFKKQQIQSKVNEKRIGRLNIASWTFGSLAMIAFLISLYLDIKTGFTLSEKKDATVIDTGLEKMAPAPNSR